MIINILPAVILGITIVLILLQRLLNIKDEQNLILSSLGAFLALIANFHYLPGLDPAGINTDFLARLAAGAGLLTVIFTAGLSFGEKNLEDKCAGFSILLLCGTVGLIAATASFHLLVIFVGLELVSLSCYFLSSPGKKINFPKIFLHDSVTTILFLGGLSLLFLETGSLKLNLIAEQISQATTTGQAGLLFLIIALFYRGGIIPFHKVQFYEETEAITPAAYYNSIIPRLFSFFVLIRLIQVIPEFETWNFMLIILAALTIIGANLLASVQKDPRKMLVYSSIAHGGYLLAGLTTLQPEGHSAVIFYIFLLVVMNCVAYGIIFKQTSEYENKNFENLAGFARRHLLVGGCGAVALFSLAGFIPTGGFMARFYLFQSILADNNYFLLFAVFTGILISIRYYSRTIIYLYSIKNEKKADEVFLHPFFYPGCFIGAVIIFYAGLYPGNLMGIILMGLSGG